MDLETWYEEDPSSHMDLLSTAMMLTKSESSSGSPPADARQPAASVEAMREMIFRIAAMQPVQIDPEAVKPPRRRNVRISTDPQSVAARLRRERISERIRILQRMVPGGTKMDTASMLDEAVHYVKFLQSQVQSLERAASSGGGDLNQAYPAAHGGDDQCLFQYLCHPQQQQQQLDTTDMYW